MDLDIECPTEATDTRPLHPSPTSLNDRLDDVCYDYGEGEVLSGISLAIAVVASVAFGPRQMGLPEPEVEKRVEDCLRLLGIGEQRSRVPYHLSGGEKRRVALAAVLALNPEVLVLDEPMSGLDPRMKNFLREIVSTLNRAGETIVCSSHDFTYVDGPFETAIVIGADHRVARAGLWAEIMADEVFLREQNII